MAVLSSCCGCHSVRRGSFLSAIYTLVYFFIFSIVSGSMVLQGLLTWLMEEWEVEDIRNNTLANELDGEDFRPPLETTGAHPFVTCMVVVDFICEMAGFFVSIVLICGLKKEKKSLLIPWMVVVPLHTLIDSCIVIYIIIDHCTKSRITHEMSQTIGTVIYILVDLLLNCLNMYVILCVVSQYQEYNDGRGTAAYEGLFTHRNSESVNYMNPMRDLHSMNSLIRSPNQRRTSQRSDTWNDESCVNPTDLSPTNGRPHYNRHGSRKGSYGANTEKNHVVRFGSITTAGELEGSGKSFLAPDSYQNPRSSLSDKSTLSSSVVEESTAESVAEL